MVDFTLIIQSLFSAIALAGLYALWNLAIWCKNAVLSRWTVTFNVSTDDYPQWQWVTAYTRVHMGRISHWLPRLDSTRLRQGITAYPRTLHFEGVKVRISIRASQAPTLPPGHYQSGQIWAMQATLWARGVDDRFFERFLKAARREHVKLNNFVITCETPLKYSHGQVGVDRVEIQARPLSSITLKDDILESVVAEIEEFTKPETRQRYYATGMPYRRGYLLHGPPGNGKTSFIVAIASHFGANVRQISLGGTNFDDSDLHIMFQSADQDGPPRIHILEDIDCLLVQARGTRVDSSLDTTPPKGITLSGLLNTLDGVSAPSNTLFFMTTNYPDRLDPALTRPGRIDRHIRFDDPDDTMVMQHYLKFYPQESSLSERALVFRDKWLKHKAECANEGKGASMASVQELLKQEDRLL